MKKRHGPDFRKQLPRVERCDACDGKGRTLGLFHELDCLECDAFGAVEQGTGLALTKAQQVAWLKHQLDRVRKQNKRMRSELVALDEFRRQKAAADLAEAVYPQELTRERARTGRGGYGD